MKEALQAIILDHGDTKQADVSNRKKKLRIHNRVKALDALHMIHGGDPAKIKSAMGS